MTINSFIKLLENCNRTKSSVIIGCRIQSNGRFDWLVSLSIRIDPLLQERYPKYEFCDWFADGYLYYSDPYENTLDPLYSLSLPPGSVPMISIIQTHSQKLGPPYSKCVKQNALTFYEQYTQDQCIFEVLPIYVCH